MNNYARTARRLGRELAPLDRAREATLVRSRAIIQVAGELIRALHRHGWDRVGARRLEADKVRLHALVRRHPFLADHGAVVQAFQEYAEAQLLRAFLARRAPPSPERLRVPSGAYLLGMADFVGELRRVVLSRLLKGDLPGAETAFDAMEKVYEALVDSKVPYRIVPLREKTDAARSIVERTRGELVTAKRAKELERKIEGVDKLLEEAEGGPVRRVARKPKDELDLDAAWNRRG